MDAEPEAIVPTSITPEYCSQCGTALETRPFEDRRVPFCPSCRYLFSKTPVPAVQVIVHGDGEVLLVEEPHTEETLWNFPGGAADPGESARAATVRELAEETGLSVEPSVLSLHELHLAEFERLDYYVVTYTVPRTAATGELEAAEEMAGAEFWSVEAVLDATERTRDADREQLRAFLGA